jgi:hypothetical protein
MIGKIRNGDSNQVIQNEAAAYRVNSWPLRFIFGQSEQYWMGLIDYKTAHGGSQYALRFEESGKIENAMKVKAMELG